MSDMLRILHLQARCRNVNSMTEKQYKGVGYGIFGLCLLIALYWCYNGSGLYAYFLDWSFRLFDTGLPQISGVVTFAVIGLPAFLVKRYFEHKAWDAHVAALPKADPRQSAKRSKYVRTDNLPPGVPQAVDLTSLPEGQQEFIVTCGACGHLFSGKKGVKELKCPSCGEPTPVA